MNGVDVYVYSGGECGRNAKCSNQWRDTGKLPVRAPLSLLSGFSSLFFFFYLISFLLLTLSDRYGGTRPSVMLQPYVRTILPSVSMDLCILYKLACLLANTYSLSKHPDSMSSWPLTSVIRPVIHSACVLVEGSLATVHL